MAEGGAVVLDLIGKEDFALGTGTFQQVHPGGGTQIASKVNLASFAFLDQSQAEVIPVLAAGGFYNNSVACAGVSVGDFVLVSFSGPLTTTNPIIISTGVASGIVKVSYYSPQGSVQLSGTLRILVFKA